MKMQKESLIWQTITALFSVVASVYMNPTWAKTLSEDEILSAAEVAEYSTSDISKLEPDALDSASSRARRRGINLTLYLKSGKEKILTSNKSCRRIKNCAVYYLLGYLVSKQYFLIYKGLSEGGEFILVDEVSGEEHNFDDLPRFSPSGENILILKNSDLSDSEGIELWQNHEHNIKLEYSGSPADQSKGARAYYYLDKWLSDYQVMLRAKVFLGVKQSQENHIITLSFNSKSWSVEFDHVIDPQATYVGKKE